MTRRRKRRTALRTRSSVLRLLAVTALITAAAGCGGSSEGGGTPGAPAVQRLVGTTLFPNAKPLVFALPPRWRISLQARFSGPSGVLRIGLGSNAVSVFDGAGTWHRVVVTARRLTVDGHVSSLSAGDSASVSLRAQQADVEVRGLVIRRGRR